MIAVLVSARAAIDAVLLEVTQEAPTLQVPDGLLLPEGTCQHKNRQDFKTFGSVEHWVCQDCGYEFRR
jgi:hypothetical protein